MKEIYNIELRSRVLEYSLVTESLINNLVLHELGIFSDKDKTRLFNNSGRMSFQSKIDLLSDINVLPKKERLEFELLMNIRNKFMHDLYCSTFIDLLKNLDKGIVNRFKKFLNAGGSISNEEDCKIALDNLFKKISQTLRDKVNELRSKADAKHKFIKYQLNKIDFYNDFTYDFINELLDVVEDTDIGGAEVVRLKIKIGEIVTNASKKLKIEVKSNTPYDMDEFRGDVNLLFGIRSTHEN